jgi:CHAT domain-containing protein
VTTRLDTGDLASSRYRFKHSAGDLLRADRHYRLVLAAPNAPMAARVTAAARLMALRSRNRNWSGVVEAYQRVGSTLETLARVQLFLESDEDWLTLAQGLPAQAAFAHAAMGRLDRAAEAFEQGLARRLAAASGADRALLEECIRDEHPGEYERLTRTALQLRAAARAMVDPGNPARGARERMQTADLRREFDEAVERIRSLPRCEGLFHGSTLDDVFEAAAPGSALVYCATGTTGTLALAVTHDGSAPCLDAVWAKQFDTRTLDDLLVERRGNEILGGYVAGQLFDDDAGRLRDSFRAALTRILAELGNHLAAPLAARLRERGVERVTLIPLGRLTLLPLHAATFADAHRTTHLSDAFEVAYAPSARALTRARTRAAANRGQPRVGAVGNPVPTEQPLPFAAWELAEIAALFPAAVCLAGARATKAAVLDLLPDRTHVHFACHGVFDPGAPLRSHLALAGETLTLADIRGTAPSGAHRLVSLSACRTAIAHDYRLPDEPAGVATGFLEAGAAGVMATLWPVDDLAAALLTRNFYRRHRLGATPAAALRDAQRWLRELSVDAACDELERWLEAVPGQSDYAAVSDAYRSLYVLPPGARPFEHPWYWAAFTFSGA